MDLESLQKEVRAILFSPYKIAGHMIKYQYLFDDERTERDNMEHNGYFTRINVVTW